MAPNPRLDQVVYLGVKNNFIKQDHPNEVLAPKGYGWFQLSGIFPYIMASDIAAALSDQSPFAWHEPRPLERFRRGGDSKPFELMHLCIALEGRTPEQTVNHIKDVVGRLLKGDKRDLDRLSIYRGIFNNITAPKSLWPKL